MRSCHALKTRLAKALGKLAALEARRAAAAERLAAKSSPASVPAEVGGLMPEQRRGEPPFFNALRRLEAEAHHLNAYGQAESYFNVVQWLCHGPGPKTAGRRKLAEAFEQLVISPPGIAKAGEHASALTSVLAAWIAAVRAPLQDRASLYLKVAQLADAGALVTSQHLRTHGEAFAAFRLFAERARSSRARLEDLARHGRSQGAPPKPLRVPSWALQASMYNGNLLALQICEPFAPELDIVGWVEPVKGRWLVRSTGSAIGFDNQAGFPSADAAAEAWLYARYGERFGELLGAAKRAARTGRKR